MFILICLYLYVYTYLTPWKQVTCMGCTRTFNRRDSFERHKKMHKGYIIFDTTYMLERKHITGTTQIMPLFVRLSQYF